MVINRVREFPPRGFPWSHALAPSFDDAHPCLIPKTPLDKFQYGRKVIAKSFGGEWGLFFNGQMPDVSLHVDVGIPMKNSDDIMSYDRR